TVNFETNGGSKMQSQKIASNGKLSEPTDPQRDQYVFYGWYLDRQLTQTATFPLIIKGDTTLYADWLRVEETGRCADASIKFWANNNYSANYSLTPTGFDYDKLNKAGYSMKIKVTYDVYYEKDYDVWQDIGYAGAPKYEAYILNSKSNGYGNSNMTTTTEKQTKTFECTLKMGDIQNETWSLKFSTDNIQNIVHFENIQIEYKCVK
ncbi:MAG: InlB B-repeat-containing protein, partial [Clostridia bacterium]|nr:InlB B-repeat-containing protein [Clostridia bacterium]